MLECYYESKRTIWRLNNCGLLGPLMEGFAQFLSKKMLSKNTIRGYIRAAGHISRYAIWEGKTNVAQFDLEFASRFIQEHLPVCSCERMNSGAYASTTGGVWHILDFLSMRGLISSQKEIEPDVQAPRPSYSGWMPNKNSRVKKQKQILKLLPETIGGLLIRYDTYLERMFGLCQKTRDIHRSKMLLFLKWVHETHGADFELCNLMAQDILAFQEMCNESGYSDDYR